MVGAESLCHPGYQEEAEGSALHQSRLATLGTRAPLEPELGVVEELQRRALIWNRSLSLQRLLFGVLSGSHQLIHEQSLPGYRIRICMRIVRQDVRLSRPALCYLP